MSKKTGKTLGKILVSGILAFILLTFFCHFYYNIPVHQKNRDGATDYNWESGVFYSRGTEGFAWGRTNNEGYSNLFDYEDGTQVDVLLMGSSHMEAFQVALEESTASQLDALLEEQVVYNIGVSSHGFLSCAANLEAALEKYQPSGFVIIETNRVSFSESGLTNAVNGTTAEISAHTEGLLAKLQANPYLRRLYAQMVHYLDNRSEETESVQSMDPALHNALLNTLLSRLSAIAEENRTKLIIFYHSGVEILSDGTMKLSCDPSAVEQFRELCEANGIYFLDMGQRFTEEYASDYTLPYGFSNSAVGTGHLNAHGHAMIADELCKLIREVE